ncbi:MAG TPA: NosD domain-containing protein [Ignavibacteriaceae bacterium]|nr:NosD domain-containing protein [Ignavibacteriaceae bacterium]
MSKTLFLALIFLISAAFLYPQNTYYVSVDGDDSNSGHSTDSAFATLQHAADLVAAGDSVKVLPGNYTGFDLRTGGTQSSHIVFKAVNENVIINQPNTVTNDGINIEEANWIVIDGFKIINQPRAGIRIAVSDFVTVRNNECSSNSRWGIFTGFTDDILIENNVCSFSGAEHGIYVSNSGDRPVIRNNVCFENNACGIQLNADLSQGGDGIITGAVIDGNILYNNGYNGGSAINLDGVQESWIYNNLLYNNHSTGIALFRIDGAEGSKNNEVYNNTIIVPADGRWAVQSTDGSTGDTVYNNILINHHSFRGSINIDQESEPGFYSDYNLLENRFSSDGGNSNMTLEQWQSLGYDAHSFLTSAESEIFNNPSGGDYHLKAGSQPVDIGTDMVLPVVVNDMDNIPRPQGNGFDIGSYEFQSPAGIINTKVIKEYNLSQNYPDPFNPSTNIIYRVKNEGFVSLKVYNVTGSEIAVLVNEKKSPGEYQINFNGTNLSSGVYIYQLRTENFVQSRKMMLVR